MPEGFMMRLDDLLCELSPEAFERDFTRFVDGIVSVLLARDPSRFLNAHSVPVDGAEQSFIGFKFDWSRFKLALDEELASTLRTASLEFPRGNRSVCHDVSLPDLGSQR